MNSINFSFWPSGLVLFLLSFFIPLTFATENNTMIKMTTSLGEIKIETFDTEAPVTVKNFVHYVEEGFFDGTIFHRVIPGFMVQGGGFTVNMKQKSNGASIINEADNGLKNTKGSLSMARTNDPNSATSQFFINLVDNPFLDFSAKSAQGWGYAVFARVTEGMDVVEQMAHVSTGNAAGHRDVPDEAIIIEKAEIIY